MADKDRSDLEDAETGAPLGGQSVTAGEGSVDQPSAEEQARLEARRRVLLGGLASVPVMLTLTSRPALAGRHHGGGGNYGNCGMSGMMSGNTSHGHNDETSYCRGKKPKWWKVKSFECHRHFYPGPCNPIYMDYYDSEDYSVPTKHELIEYKKKLKEYPWNRDKIRTVNEYLGWLDQCPELDDTPPFGMPFAEVFGGIAQDDKLTMMQALWLDDEFPYPPSGNAGPSPLLANIAAAYCNACEYGKDGFGLSEDELVEMVGQEVILDPLGLEDKLKMLNDQG